VLAAFFPFFSEPPTSTIAAPSSTIPVLSIVIPAFNVASDIPNAISSCFRQDFLDFEIICVLDGSTDSTEDVILSLAEIWPQIRIIRHSSHLGSHLARRSGALAARGDFIMSLDADDLYLAGIFSAVIDRHRRTGADVIQFEAMKCRFGEKPKVWAFKQLPRDLMDNAQLVQAVKEGRVMWNMWLLSVKRELVVKVFAYLDVNWNKFCIQEEDRLQSYMIFYFAERFAVLHKAGYLYIRYPARKLTRIVERYRHLKEVRKYLEIVYQFPLKF
jgi:glycosyltransferase involved in cell wall biosynthesis